MPRSTMLPLVKHQDQVGVADRTEAMRHDKARTIQLLQAGSICRSVVPSRWLCSASNIAPTA